VRDPFTRDCPRPGAAAPLHWRASPTRTCSTRSRSGIACGARPSLPVRWRSACFHRRQHFPRRRCCCCRPASMASRLLPGRRRLRLLESMWYNRRLPGRANRRLL